MQKNSWVECLYNGQWIEENRKVWINGIWQYVLPPGNYTARRVTRIVDNELRYDDLAFGYTIELNRPNL